MANTPSVNTQNILVGAASLYVANTGTVDNTAKPAFAVASYRTTLEGTPWNPASTDASTAAA